MRRRSFLKGMAASGLQLVLPPVLLAAGSGRSVMRRVRPPDPQWPGAASWAKLSAAVGGNLTQPQALFAACQRDPNGVACADVLENWSADGFTRLK